MITRQRSQVWCAGSPSSAGPIQRNATGALLNMIYSGSFNFLVTHLKPVEETHVSLFPDEHRQQLADAGAVPVLVSLLNSPDTDVQYSCTTALSNIALDSAYILRRPMCLPNVKLPMQRSTNSKLSWQTVYIPFFAFCGPLTFHLAFRSRLVCIMCPFILQTSCR